MGSMARQLDLVRGKKFIGVAELVAQAARMLGLVAPVQDRGTVTEVPDDRTVRYYLNKGLISPAEEKRGTSSVFGYRHLLQLLAVKKLQSENLPIRKIRDLVPGREERDLERLLGLEGGSGPDGYSDAARYLDSLLISAPLPPAILPEPSGTRSAGSLAIPPQAIASTKAKPSARSGDRAELPVATASDDRRLADPAEVTSPVRSANEITFSVNAGTWDRVEIQPGLELHIRRDYKPPAEGRELRGLARLILEGIEGHNQKTER
jgi:DNA-binding transcriptional MerR regulator